MLYGVCLLSVAIPVIDGSATCLVLSYIYSVSLTSLIFWSNEIRVCTYCFVAK